ncbi:MAG: hypothetical protein JWP21_3320, partial [Tardiphaga sp.]|nr:hypothetical protein [Tardiphaga sp.]
MATTVFRLDPRHALFRRWGDSPDGIRKIISYEQRAPRIDGDTNRAT